MNIETYNKATILLERKETLLSQLENLRARTTHNNTPVIDIGWICLSYGNGSWNKPILDNENRLIHQVYNLIESLLNSQIEDIDKLLEEL